MADPTKAWHKAFDSGSKELQNRLKKVHAKNPKFQDFLKSRGVESGERSAKQATASLKKSTDTKVAAQKIADMRYKKALQSSSERVREMGRRRREGGEGLGGGLETARDVVAHVKRYGSIKAGRLGEETVQEADDRINLIKRAAVANKMGKPTFLAKVNARAAQLVQKKKDDEVTKSKANFGMSNHPMKFEEVVQEATITTTKKEAEAVLGGPVKEKPKMPPGKQPAGYRYVRNLARKAMKKGMKEEIEPVLEQDDSMEKKEMAQTQLHFMAYAAKEILEFIDMGGEIEEWYQNKLSKVQSEVESLHSYIEGEKRRTGMVKEEEQIDEKAPPGAKFERMVKHIKKGYAKGGLTKQEKSIAYATAWKAYGKKEEVETDEETLDEKYMGFKKVMAAAKEGGARDPAAVAAAIGRKKYGKEKFQAAAAAGKKMGEEVEVVAEAEGTVAVTPKEKALAAHHGDPKKITYGDVIKARLKSVAAKKMGK